MNSLHYSVRNALEGQQSVWSSDSRRLKEIGEWYGPQFLENVPYYSNDSWWRWRHDGDARGVTLVGVVTELQVYLRLMWQRWEGAAATGEHDVWLQPRLLQELVS